MDRRKLLLVVAVVVALAGAGLVYMYADKADTRAAAAYDPVTVFVAQSDIAVGESFDTALASGKIASRDIPSTSRVPSAITTTDDLAGKTANSPIAKGEQILTSNYGGEVTATALAIPDGMLAISVELSDTSRVAGFVNAGSEVAVWMTYDVEAAADETGSGTKQTRLLLDRVRVIAVGSTSTQPPTVDAEGNPVAAAEQLPRTLMTLAVLQDDAERLKLASQTGTLSFGLLTPKSVVKPSKGVDLDSIFR